MINPKSPSNAFRDKFIHPTLLQAPSYKIDATKVTHKIDQNESPLDWPASFKDKVLEILRKQEWNRYPQAQSPKETAMVAKLQNVPPDCILTQSGSDSILTILLRSFALQKKTQLVLAEPSFPVVAMQAQTHNIPFSLWPLTENFDYDPELLPQLGSQSVVFFASPNNPTGSILKKEVLEQLLTLYPNTLWIADEAYVEFYDNGFKDLIGRFSNLILVRTLSKAWAAAGTRLGYIIAAKEWIDEFKKFRLAYALNYFNSAVLEVIAHDTDLQNHMEQQLQDITKQKNRVIENLQARKQKLFEVFPSEANFFMMRFTNQNHCNEFYKFLIKNDMIVRNISSAPRLARCLRVSVGTEEQNSVFIKLVDAYNAKNL